MKYDTQQERDLSNPQRKIVFYELNEVSPNILKRYIEKFPNSSLAKIYNKSNYYLTVNTDIGQLSPWITWPTLHRGVNNRAHNISALNQNLTMVNKTYPNYFDILARNKITVGVFGSLQSYPIPDELSNYSFYIPDTFASNAETHPKNIECFQKLNLYMTSKNGRNIQRSLPILEIFNFLKDSLHIGITVKTIRKIMIQLINESLNNHLIIRRRTTQAQLSFDIFYNLLSIEKPSLATFFTNHVASSMHRYWPAAFPNDYTSFRMPTEWIQKYKDEIWHTMHAVDYHINKLLKFIQSNPDYSLVISSSMGQGPVQKSTKISNQLYLTSPNKFFEFLGIPKEVWSQRLTMAPVYVFTFQSKQHLINCKSLIDNFSIRSENLHCHVIDDLSIQLSFGHENCKDCELILYKNTPVDMKTLGLEIIDIQDETGSYAYHIPEGILLIFNGSNKQINNINIKTTNIAPSLLKHFDVSIPEYMGEAYPLF